MTKTYCFVIMNSLRIERKTKYFKHNAVLKQSDYYFSIDKSYFHILFTH